MREREGGKKGRGKRGKKTKKKKKNTPITASSSLALACFYLSMTNSSIHSLLSSFLHIFSSPYLLSQHCITCHFRIMSPHVYNDIAFVLQITLGFSVPPPPPSPPTHMDAGIKIHLHTRRHTQTCKCQRKYALIGAWVGGKSMECFRILHMKIHSESELEVQAKTIFKVIYLYIKNVTSRIFPAHILEYEFFLASFSDKEIIFLQVSSDMKQVSSMYYFCVLMSSLNCDRSFSPLPGHVS